MEVIGYAALQVIPSMKGAKAAIEGDLGSVGTDAGRRVGGNISSGISSALRGAATGAVGIAAAGIGVALTKGMGRLVAIDNATAKLRGLGHTSAGVEKIMESALASVKGTAFGLGDAATIAASAVAAGVKPGKDLTGYLTLAGDAATIAGVSMNEMGSIFGKVQTSQRAYTAELNQLADRGIPIFQWLQDEYGVTSEELRKMVSAGKVDADTFYRVINENIGGAAQESGKTFTGAMANIGASFGRVGANFLGGVFPKMAPLFQSISTAMGPIEDAAAKVGEAIGTKLVPIIERVTAALSGSGGLSGSMDVATQVIGPAVAAFVALGASGLSPLLKMVPGLGGLGGALGALGGPVGIAVAAFVGLIATSPALRDAIADVFNVVAPAIENFVNAVLPPLLAALSNIMPVVAQFATVLIEGLGAAFGVVAPIVTTLVGALVGLLIPITENETAVKVLVAALGIWGGVVGGIAIWGLVTSLYAKVTALYASTAAWVANTAAMVVSKAETAYLVGLYAVDFVKAVGKAVVAQMSLLAAYARSIIASAAISAGLIAQRVAMVAVTVATKAWAAAQWLMNAALAANPLGIVIALVVAAVAAIVLLWQNSETFREIVLTVWDAVKAAMGAVAEWVTDTLVPALQDAWTTITDAVASVGQFFVDTWDGIKSGTRKAWDAITGFVRKAGEAIVKVFTNFTLPGLLMKHWDSISGTARTVWDAIVGFVGKIPDRIWNGLKAIGGWVARNIGGAFRSIVTGAKDWFRNLLDFIRDIPQKIVKAIGDVGSLLFNAGKSILTGLYNGLVDSWNNKVAPFLNKVTGWIPDWKGPPDRDAKLLVNNGRLVMGGFRRGLESAMPDVRASLAAFTDSIGDAVAVDASLLDDIARPMRPVVSTPAFGDNHRPGGGVTVEQHNYYPQAEPESKTIDRAHELLGLAGAL